MIDIDLSDMLAMHALEKAFDAAPPRRRKPVEMVLRPIQPNAGLAAAYSKRLMNLLDEVQASTIYWLTAAYRANPPAIAQDETSAEAMKRAMRSLSARWLRKFDDLGQSLSGWFAQSVQNRSDAALKKILKDAGWTVDFTTTKAQRDVLAAVVNENASLIKSIPAQSLANVEGVVMRSVQAGLDAGAMAKEVEKVFGVTKRRAQFIAKDQTRKTTAMLSRARHLELGLDEAIWVHSGGGRHPRPSHAKAGRDRVRYSIAEGWLDPASDRRIWPGTEINCRCIGRPVVKGFS